MITAPQVKTQLDDAVNRLGLQSILGKFGNDVHADGYFTYFTDIKTYILIDKTDIVRANVHRLIIDKVRDKVEEMLDTLAKIDAIVGREPYTGHLK